MEIQTGPLGGGMSGDVSTDISRSLRSHFQTWEVTQLRGLLGRAFTR